MIKLSRFNISILATIVVASLASNGARATELGDLAASMQPGTFVELPMSGFNDSFLYWDGYHGLQYTDSLKWDPIRKQVHYTGAGHQATTRHLVYSESTNQWVLQEGSGIGFSHGYDHAAIDPESRTYFYREIAGDHIKFYDLDSRTWQRGPNFPGQTQVAGGIAWFPEMQRLVFVDSYLGLVALNRATNGWSTINGNLDIGPYHNFAEYSAGHGVVILGGGNGSRTVYRLDGNGRLDRVSNSPIDIGISHSLTTVDPVTGDFLVIGRNGQFYSYDPSADQWQTVSVTPPSDLFTNTSDGGTWGLLATPISTHGVVFFAKYNGDNSKVYLYKHAPSSGTAPPAVSLTASPTTVSSGGSTILTWSVSNTNSCTAGGDWSGSKNAGGGTETISNIVANATYDLTCSGAGGSDTARTTVTVSTGGGGDQDNDWIARSTAPGVLMTTRFDTFAEVENGKAGSSQGNITWDQTRKVSGNGSMRMDILSTDSTSSGNWRRYLSDDQRPFNPGDEFYVQFRQYVPSYVIEHVWNNGNAQGFKSSIISHYPNSNTDFEVVIQNTRQRGYIQGYYQDGVSSAVHWERGVSTACNSNDFRHQPAIDHGPQNVGTPCENDRARYGGLYSYLSNLGGSLGDPDPLTGAFVYEKDNWITILQHIRISPSGYSAGNSLIETWAAKDGEDYVLLVSDNNIRFGNSGRFDTLWLLHYRSDAQSDGSRQNTFTNYDEVIVSTNFIPAPGRSGPAPVVKTPMPPTDLAATSQ